MQIIETSLPEATGPGDMRFNPSAVVPYKQAGKAAGSRQSQRQRRALILATIRQLLVEQGVKGVTIRRIAEASGLAVQTIYNLVGPRDEAILEAISEYTRHVGRLTVLDMNEPDALSGIVDRWLASVEAAPEFCREVSLIFFTDSRSIFYALRDRELKGMHALLKRQQECGVLRADINARDLAEQMVLFASALCVEWSDRPFPLDQLKQRLAKGFTNLLAGAIAPGGRYLRLAFSA